MKIQTILLKNKGAVSAIETNNIDITKFTLRQLKGILKVKGQGKIELLHTYDDTVSLFGWKKGKAGTENKHDLPPPIDSDLYFGDILVYRHAKNNSLVNFSKKEWKTWYEKKFGGFEDLGSEDTESEPDSIEVDEDYHPGDELDEYYSDDLKDMDNLGNYLVDSKGGEEDGDDVEEEEEDSDYTSSDEETLDLDELLESDSDTNTIHAKDKKIEFKKPSKKTVAKKPAKKTASKKTKSTKSNYFNDDEELDFEVVE